MKSILRAVVFNLIVLYTAILVYPGMVYDNSFKTLFLATVTLTVLNRVVKPLIKLLLLPINLVTLGFFSWVANVATLFILTRIVSGFVVKSFFYEGFTYNGFVVPAMPVSILASYILASVTISLVAGFLSFSLRK